MSWPYLSLSIPPLPFTGLSTASRCPIRWGESWLHHHPYVGGPEDYRLAGGWGGSWWGWVRRGVPLPWGVDKKLIWIWGLDTPTVQEWPDTFDAVADWIDNPVPRICIASFPGFICVLILRPIRKCTEFQWTFWGSTVVVLVNHNYYQNHLIVSHWRT